MRALLQYTLDLFGEEPAHADRFLPVPATDAARTQRVAPAAPGDRRPDAAFRHPRANREASLCGHLVAYELTRCKRRSIGLSVGAEGLMVRAPRWVSVSDVQQAIDERASWIVRKLLEARARQARLQANRIVWRDGATLPFLGAPVRMVLDPSHVVGGPGACLQVAEPGGGEAPGGELRLGLPRHASEQQMRDMVQAWLMRQARRVFIDRLDHFAPRLRVQWRKLSLSSAASRWGSARADGSIRLHWRLIHLRVDVIDYVIAHELSHLRVMDHSPLFWDTVRSVMPDYQARRGELREESIPPWD